MLLCSGKWHGAPVAVKVVRLPLRVRQHSDGAQPKSVSPISHYVAHPNLVSHRLCLIDAPLRTRTDPRDRFLRQDTPLQSYLAQHY